MKMNGFRPSHRNRFLLVKHNVLARDEFIVFEYLLDKMGFDKRNDKFGISEIDYKEISLVLQYSAKPPYNSIRKKVKKLLQLGILISTDEKNKYKIFNPDRYIPNSKKWLGKANDFQKLEQNQQFEQIIQNIAPNFQNNERTIQKKEQNNINLLKKEPSRTLSSSKVRSSFFYPNGYKKTIKNNTVKSDEEYQRLYRENPDTYPTPEDMKWIDEHLGADGKTKL